MLLPTPPVVKTSTRFASERFQSSVSAHVCSNPASNSMNFYEVNALHSGADFLPLRQRFAGKATCQSMLDVRIKGGSNEHP